jgi:hypothetical protein
MISDLGRDALHLNQAYRNPKSSQARALALNTPLHLLVLFQYRHMLLGKVAFSPARRHYGHNQQYSILSFGRDYLSAVSVLPVPGGLVAVSQRIFSIFAVTHPWNSNTSPVPLPCRKSVEQPPEILFVTRATISSFVSGSNTSVLKTPLSQMTSLMLSSNKNPAKPSG